jgi:hypothetical protein
MDKKQYQAFCLRGRKIKYPGGEGTFLEFVKAAKARMVKIIGANGMLTVIGEDGFISCNMKEIEAMNVE